MISTRSGALVIDTIVCLTLAKWETVSGRFGGYLKRRFAVILAADVVGYTRLMEADEEGTLAQLGRRD
jgi:class 3 adenylate cyclase